MGNDIISVIRRDSIHPFCSLSDRGLQAVFSGFMDIVHMTEGEVVEFSPEDCQYTTVINGGLDILQGSAQHKQNVIQRHDTASGPMVHCGRDGIIRFRAREDSIFLNGSGDFVDDVVSIDALAAQSSEDIDVLQLVLMRSAKCFNGLSTTQLIKIYSNMDEIEVAAGHEVVRQDAKGDKFYFIRDGAAEVWREELDDDEPRHVATLATGDAFGEEALILGGARNATIKMITPGRLLTLDEEKYTEMVSKKSIVRITVDDAKSRIEKGAQLVDVRYDDEWEEGHIFNARHIPLNDLRSRIAELDKTKEVVVYCRSGRRSQVGAILLSQNGFSATSMDGGILEWDGKTVTP